MNRQNNCTASLFIVDFSLQFQFLRCFSMYLIMVKAFIFLPSFPISLARALSGVMILPSSFVCSWCFLMWHQICLTYSHLAPDLSPVNLTRTWSPWTFFMMFVPRLLLAALDFPDLFWAFIFVMELNYLLLISWLGLREHTVSRNLGSNFLETFLISPVNCFVFCNK